MNKQLNLVHKELKNPIRALVALIAFVALSSIGLNTNDQSRSPASAGQDAFTLELKQMKLNDDSQLDKIENFYLRIVFEGQEKDSIDFGKKENWILHKGKQMDLNLHVDINPKWIKDDSLKFRIEIKKPRQILSDATVVRCAFHSKKLSEYDRSYTCALPKEENKAPLLSYRLFKNKSHGNMSFASK